MSHALTKDEYRAALRADHGTVRRFLAGCRCPLCDRPAHRRFAKRHRAKGKSSYTPAAFRDVLLDMARSAVPETAAT